MVESVDNIDASGRADQWAIGPGRRRTYAAGVARGLIESATGPELPIDDAVESLQRAANSGGFVLVAEPGAGKSTRVGLAVADVVSGSVVVLQPRRAAARSLAERVASSLGEPVGQRVGLTMRGDRRVSGATRVEFVTEAILTNRLHEDPTLPGIGAVIFDEFHERSLHADLGLAMAIESRSAFELDLVIGVMSATIDPGPVAALLGDAPVIDVPGRSHAVEVTHRARPHPDRWEHEVATVAADSATTGSDVLVFLPGRGEIRRVAARLPSTLEVVELHAGVGTEAFRALDRAPIGARVILATSIAETSITLPHVGVVVDGGRSRRPQYDPVTGLGRLITTSTSRFSAGQRAGRAGRVRAGRAIRLWSDHDHGLLDDAETPAILAGDPAELALHLARWGDPAGEKLPLLDRPPADRLEVGRRQLAAMGLVDERCSVTDIGRQTVRLGIGARSGRAVLALADDPARAARLGAVLEADDHHGALHLEDRLRSDDLDLRRAAARLERRLERAGPGGPSLDVAAALAGAWPDRVARRRPGSDRFLLASGRELRLPDGAGPVSDDIIVTHGDADPTTGRIRGLVELDPGTLDTLDGSLRTIDRDLGWTDTGRIAAHDVERFGAIELRRRPSTVDDADARSVWDQLILDEGLASVVPLDRAAELLARVRHARDVDDRFPDLSVEALTARRDEWLDLGRLRRRSETGRLDVTSAIRTLVGWDLLDALDRLAPTVWRVGSGRTVPIRYESGEPTASVILQHVLGESAHPMVGRTPVVVELLSPARRPIQITRDLPGFWSGSYRAVRADLRGRYTKHAWPEDPLAP